MKQSPEDTLQKLLKIINSNPKINKKVLKKRCKKIGLDYKLLSCFK